MLTILIILAALFQGLIALFVFLKRRSNLTNVLFTLLSVSLIGWAVTNYIATTGPQSTQTLTMIRLVIFFVVCQNSFFLLFAQTFPGDRIRLKPGLLLAFGAFSLVVLADALSPYLFTGVVITHGAASPLPGPGIILFVLHAAISVVGGIGSLIKKYRSSRGILRAQLKYILAGAFILWLVVPVTNFALTLWLQTNLFAKVGPLYTFVFSSLMAYVIVRHRFLDIRLILARTVAYVLLLISLATLYGLAVFGASSLLLKSQHLPMQQNLLSVVLAMVLAFTFQPLRRLIEKLTDRIFYRDRYDSQEVLNRLSKILASELLLDRLLDQSLTEICRDLRVEFGQFMVFDKNKIYKIAHYGPLPERILTAPNLRKLNHRLLVADELGPGQRKEIMDNHGVRLSLILRTKEEFVGFLLLGDKLSGDIYSDQDLQLLEILSSELAVAIINAKAYAEIAQFNVTLQERVNQATSRLRVANRNLKALDKTKDEFLSMASHQLRTPLTTIKGYLSMIVEGDAGNITPQQHEFIEYALGGAERMIGLISDLLNVSRLSAGRFLIEKQPVDLAEVVADEVRQLQSHADARALKLVFIQPARKLPLVDLDEGKTRQVIMNFIDNAIYYTKQGSVTVSIEVEGGVIRLKVIDTGIGVPEAARKQLFSKFFRAENAQIARPDGTGLGLYLAKRVIEDQGGKVIFESEVGKGSTFGFEMPIGHAETAKKPVHLPSPSKVRVRL